MHFAQFADPRGWGGGSIEAHSEMATGQRVRKRQPDGGFAGLGRSPFKMVRWRCASMSGSGTGTADINDLV